MLPMSEIDAEMLAAIRQAARDALRACAVAGMDTETIAAVVAEAVIQASGLLAPHLCETCFSAGPMYGGTLLRCRYPKSLAYGRVIVEPFGCVCGTAREDEGK